MPLIVTDDGERKVEDRYVKSARGWMIATIIVVVITLAFIVTGILFVAGILPVNARSGNGEQPQWAPPAESAAEKTAVATVKEHMTPAQLALGDPVVNSNGMRFVPIPAGTFTMGSPEDEAGRAGTAPLHKVTLTQPFELGVYEVTQEQYQRVMGLNRSAFKGP